MLHLSELLEPIANELLSLGIPKPIVHWGHPVMMGVVVLIMGSVVGLEGWRGRILAETDQAAADRSKREHRRFAPLMFLFIAMGYTGGVLSLVMQHQPILESSHFWTGSIALGIFAINGLLAVLGMGKKSTRAFHAYLGSSVLFLLFLHGVLGLKLGLAI